MPDATALAIERLYSRRRRMALAAAELDRRAALCRLTIAEIEAELGTLVLFVPPLIQRKPSPHFRSGELARACRAVMRERPGRVLYAGEIAIAVMRAKGLDVSDAALCRTIFRQTQDSLRRLQGRGVVVKRGTQARARWSLPEG